MDDRDVYVVGWGAGLPPLEYSSAQLGRFLGFSDEKVAKYERLTGVASRRSCWDIRTNSQVVGNDELAGQAAIAALDTAAIAASEVDCVAAGSATVDYTSPNISSRLLRHLGVEEALAVSLIGGCAAFLEAFVVACGFLRAGNADCAVVTGSEVVTVSIPAMRYGTDAFIFGDGAGAMVLTTKTPPPGRPAYRVGPSFIRTRSTYDGEQADVILHVAAGYRVPPKVEPFVIDMDPNFPELLDMPPQYRLWHNAGQARAAALPTLVESIDRVTDAATATPGVVVPHQGSRPVIDALADHLGEGWSLVDNLARRGNLSSASIPVAFAERHDQVGAAATVVLATIGNGHSYGAVRLEPVQPSVREHP